MAEILELFISFIKVGSFSFGGAFSLIPIIEKEVVQNHTWLTQDEFLKVLGMVQIVPGAISIKFATYTGYKVAGIPGALIANLGNLLTPAAIIMVATFFYHQYEKNEIVSKAFTGITMAIIGMIAAIMYQYAAKSYVDIKSIIFLILGAMLIFLFNLHPAYIVIISGILAIFIL
jgi:chromate transporter